MSSRKRKRAARRKRKQRTAAGGGPEPEAAATAGPTPDAADGGGERSVSEIAAEAEARGVSRSEVRNKRAREALEPLEEGERPRVVTAGAIVSLLIALITVGAWIVGAEVDGERPSAFQVFAPAVLFGVMAWGMWRARYWAVLGFQAVMAILMVGAFLTLVSATSLIGAITPLLVLAGTGTFFWFTVKAMARIQMPDRHLPR